MPGLSSRRFANKSGLGPLAPYSPDPALAEWVDGRVGPQTAEIIVTNLGIDPQTFADQLIAEGDTVAVTVDRTTNYFFSNLGFDVAIFNQGAEGFSGIGIEEILISDNPNNPNFGFFKPVIFNPGLTVEAYLF